MQYAKIKDIELVKTINKNVDDISKLLTNTSITILCMRYIQYEYIPIFFSKGWLNHEKSIEFENTME
jgi:hypothetical protein